LRQTGVVPGYRSEFFRESYRAEQIYLNSKTYLFGHEGAEAIEIAVGTYKYNFSVDLPPLIPGTLKGSFGSINYFAEVFLDVPWGFNKEVKVPFTVIRHDNLNDYPDLRVPYNYEHLKTFRSFANIFSKGACKISINIPHKGYAAGDSIPIQIIYENKSNFKIKETKIALKLTMAFTSYTPRIMTKRETSTVAEISTKGVDKKQSENIECVLKIPENVANSNEKFCGVVQLTYFLDIESVINEFFHFNDFPRAYFPIIIGSIGIRGPNSFTSSHASVPQHRFPVS
jgi:hypothetical protein